MAILEPLYPYPSGWYAVAFSSDLERGAVETVRYFGQDIVLFRTEAGEVAAVDPFCPHLGAHLGFGAGVEGESIRCPFHHWRFSVDGRCEEIPGCDTIPAAARLVRWPVVEQDDVICVFHDAGASGSEPREPFAFPASGLDGVTGSRTVKWTLRSHPQEICENSVDLTHLLPIHSAVNASVEGAPRLEDTAMKLELDFTAPGDIIGAPGLDNDVHLDVAVHGLGRIVVRLSRRARAL